MSNVLVAFNLYCGRMGELAGLFITSRERLESAYGYEVYFDDMLGKHSEIECELGPEVLTVKSEDQDFIAKVREVFGSDNISGVNPLDYVEECDESETTP